MTKIHRQLAYHLVNRLRHSSLRSPITKLLINTHNSSYHWISFFVSHSGTHPKHSIINYHQFFLDNISSTDTVIDLGCGAGEVAFDVSKKANSVVGVDLNQASINKARTNYTKNNLKFIVQDITTMDKSHQFDVAILSNVLEHIKNRTNFLLSTQAHANKILIRVPLITRDWLSVYKKEHNFEYRLDHTHFIEYSEESFRIEMDQAKLGTTHLHTNFGELYAVCEPTSKHTQLITSSIAKDNIKRVAY